MCKKKQGCSNKQTLLSPTSPTRPLLKAVWSTNNVPMCQCVPMNSEWTQNVKNTSGYIRPPLSQFGTIFFCGNISLHWIITTLSWKPIGSLVLCLNHSAIFFWRTVWDFCRLFGFFCHQRSGFWTWAFYIEWQTFLTLILKGFTGKHNICWLYQCNYV